MDELPYPRALAARVAAHGLPGGDEELDVPEEAWSAFHSYVCSEHLTGFALAAAETGRLRLDDARRDRLRSTHVDALTWSLALERQLLMLGAAAAEHGLEFVVLKGSALAHDFYPDAAWRTFSDVDVLVRTRDWRQACDLLRRLGFERELPEPRAGFDERFGKAAVHVNAAGLRIDLHRTLVLGSFGLWLEPESLFLRTVPLTIAGRELRRLDDTATLLHACMHASLGWRPPLLLPLRDVAQVCGVGEVDWDLLARDAARWRLRAVVRHAIETAVSLLGWHPPPETGVFLEAHSSRRERRALAAYVTPRRGRGGTARSMLRAVPGVRAKVHLLRDMLLPDKTFLAARSNGVRPSYVRRWATPVRWMLRGRR